MFAVAGVNDVWFYEDVVVRRSSMQTAGGPQKLCISAARLGGNHRWFAMLSGPRFFGSRVDHTIAGPLIFRYIVHTIDRWMPVAVLAAGVQHHC